MPEPAPPETLSLRVDEAAAGSRLDAFLAARVEGLSRAQARRLIDAGRVLLGGSPETKPALRLAAGDRVRLPRPEPAAERALIPSPALAAALVLVYQDADLILIDKPAGLVVHPAAGHADDTLVNALIARFPDLAAAFPDSPRPGIVHRLDRDTSGLMVVARQPTAAQALKAQFQARSVEKTYLCLVRGRPSPTEGLVDAPIARDPRQRQRMAAQPGGKPARTAFRVLAEAHGYSLVEARPLTGRTHQIRVHLQALGHPIAGDIVYGKRDRRVPRLALHAWQLAFDHPSGGRRMTFTAALPADLAMALDELGMRLPD